MTTNFSSNPILCVIVVEAYRLDRYDNRVSHSWAVNKGVVEAYRLDRYDNFLVSEWWV